LLMPSVLDTIRWTACSHFAQSDLALFQDRALADGDLLVARAALPQAETLLSLRVLGARLRLDALMAIAAVDHAAMWEDRTVRPDDAFDMRKGCGFVVHVGFGQHPPCEPLS